jgi:class 3 adenylate cyclase
MIGPDRLSRVSAEAAVPEQVVAYVTAVAGSRPRLVGACVGYASDGDVVLVGYPLHDPRDEQAMAAAVQEALRIPGLRRITVVGPARPPQAPAQSRLMQDSYLFLSLPRPAPRQKLRNLLRRADRELTIDSGRYCGEDHMALVGRYLDERGLEAGTRHIFRQLPTYLQASPRSLLFSARRADGRLVAFCVGEFVSLSTAFFMFCFRDRDLAPPGSTDVLLAELLDEASRRGQIRMNLGLGINAGVRFFKQKWGAEALLPYVQVSWEPASRGFFSHLRGMIRG